MCVDVFFEQKKNSHYKITKDGHRYSNILAMTFLDRDMQQF